MAVGDGFDRRRTNRRAAAPPAVGFGHLPLVSPPVPAAPPSDSPARDPSWSAAARARTWRYLRFLGCPADLAEDFAQDTLLAALRASPSGPLPDGWLLTTARNRLRMHLRTAGREQPDLERLHAEWVEVAGPDDADRRLLALRHCVDELPERSRRALQLRYGDGVERVGIGRELGLGEEGVKSLLVRLRAALAACVQRRLQETS